MLYECAFLLMSAGREEKKKVIKTLGSLARRLFARVLMPNDPRNE